MTLIILLNIVGFFRTVIFLLAIYFLFKLFTRYVLPLILENKIRQMQRNMSERNRNQDSTKRREGEVTIDYDSRKSNNIHKHDEGEYIDFEEVD